MRACTILTQHIWAGKYTVTQGTKLEADAVSREVVKAVDEGGKRVQRWRHVYRQNLVLSLCVLYHKLQDTDTLQEKLFSGRREEVCRHAPDQGSGQTRLSTEVHPCYEYHR